MNQHPRDIAPFYRRQQRPVFRLIRLFRWSNRLLVRLVLGQVRLAVIANAFRQILDPDSSITHCGGANHRVLKLADVSRPRILVEQDHGLGRKPNRRAQRIDPIRKGLGQRRNIFAALAQRWQHDRHRIQAIEQIVAKAPGFDFFVNLAVAGRDHSHVNAAGLVGTDAANLALLQHAQQLYLKRGRGFRNLVQEYRAAIGFFPETAPIAICSGE